MQVKNPSDDVKILVVCGTFIVNDDVIAVGPLRIFEQRQWRVRAGVIGPDDIDLHVGLSLDTIAQNLVLLGIVVTTSATDQQGFEWLGGRWLPSRATAQ